MATKNENKANVKANANNTTANVESAKVENESNANNANNATDESNNESKQEATTEPTAEEIAAAKVEQKHQTEITNRYKLDAPTEVEKSKFAGAYVMGVWRAPKDVKKNGDKTFFKIYFNGTIYDGYTSTEFCDAVGIERKHRNGNAPKVETLLDKLEALKTAIEAIGSEEENFVNFAKIVASKIESEQLESQRAEFVAKYAAAVKFFPKLTEQDFADENGADDLALAKKLGYKFKDTKATGNNESESKSK